MLLGIVLVPLTIWSLIPIATGFVMNSDLSLDLTPFVTVIWGSAALAAFSVALDKIRVSHKLPALIASMSYRF